jgi:hypothetical protein
MSKVVTFVPSKQGVRELVAKELDNRRTFSDPRSRPLSPRTPWVTPA